MTRSQWVTPDEIFPFIYSSFLFSRRARILNSYINKEKPWTGISIHVETQAVTHSVIQGRKEQGKVSTALRIISRDSVCYEKFFLLI